MPTESFQQVRLSSLPVFLFSGLQPDTIRLRRFQSGTSISGIIFPFIIQSLLSRYGFRVTLWSLGAVVALLIGPLLPFIRGRLPVEEGREEDGVKKYDYSFVKSGAFWLLWLVSFG